MVHKEIVKAVLAEQNLNKAINFVESEVPVFGLAAHGILEIAGAHNIALNVFSPASYEKACDEFDKLIEEGKKDEALRYAMKYKSLLAPQIADLYCEMGESKKAVQILDDAIKAFANCPDLKWLTFEHKYQTYMHLGEIVNARNACLYVLNNAPSSKKDMDDISDRANDDFNILERDYVKHFLDMPYNNRKLLVPVESYTDISQLKTLSVIDINNLPDIHFPMGHPIANQLYIGHPFIPSQYIPFENYELEFIEDKIREYCQVMQSLGAIEITIGSVNASSNSKGVNTHQKISGNAGYEKGSASASYEHNVTHKILEDISHNIQLHQKYQPHATPKLPSNLVWYANEPSWQRTYEQRMQGGLLEHEEHIETRKSKAVDNSQLTQISADVKYLFIHAGGSWEASMEEQFEAHDDVVLTIHVKFAPLESLQGNQSPASISRPSLTAKEEEYLDEVKACLEEGEEITPRERRLLNRLREKLGITEERAAELEASLQQVQLTADEKEYLEEYKACLDEGEITPKDRRLLNKLRISLNISEERAAVIENMK